jgi:proteasome lid subunit RPN8/RPN11
MPESRRRLIEEAQRVNPVMPVHIWRAPAGAAVDMVVVAHLDVYGTVHEHAAAALPNETGGFLLGRVAHDAHVDQCWLVEVEEVVPVEPIVQNPTHFQFTWRDVDRVRSYREGLGKALVGWYHTHPDLGVFLSETDLERTHRVLFSEPFQIALVYDPVRGRAGYFFWEGPQRIDPSSAAWREFAIAVEAPPEATHPAPGHRVVAQDEAGQQAGPSVRPQSGPRTPAGGPEPREDAP